MPVPGVPGHGLFEYHMAGIGVMYRMLIRLHLMMPVRGSRLRLSPLMHMRGSGCPELVHETRGGVAER